MSDESLFVDAETEFKRIIGPIPVKLKGASGTGATSAELSPVQTDLSKAEQLINTMEMEAVSSRRADLRARATANRRQFTDLQKELARAKERADRASLLSGGRAVGDMELSSDSTNARDHLLNVVNKQKANSEVLSSTRRTIAETEDVASGILVELNRNRETILRNTDRAETTRTMLGTARRYIHSMRRRTVYYKALLAFFIFVFLGIIAAVLYFMVFKPSSSSSSGSSSS